MPEQQLKSAAATKEGKTSEDSTAVPSPSICPFGSISGETLLAFDDIVEMVDNRCPLPVLLLLGSQKVASCYIQQDCVRCRQQRSCCCCNRQVNIAGRRTTPATSGNMGPEIDFGAWACGHCVRRFEVFESACESVIGANGTKKDDPRTENGHPLLATSLGSSPRSTLRDNFNRAPGGNWWGGRGQPSTNARNADAESYEFFHFRMLPHDVDNDATVVPDSTEDTSAYLALYRDRYTVLNVGSHRLGDRTLTDIDPADDPYTRKFRNNGDLFNRLQQLWSAPPDEDLCMATLPSQKSPTSELSGLGSHRSQRLVTVKSSFTSKPPATTLSQFATQSNTGSSQPKTGFPGVVKHLQSIIEDNHFGGSSMPKTTNQTSTEMSDSGVHTDNARTLIPGTTLSSPCGNGDRSSDGWGHRYSSASSTHPTFDRSPGDVNKNPLLVLRQDSGGSGGWTTGLRGGRTTDTFYIVTGDSILAPASSEVPEARRRRTLISPPRQRRLRPSRHSKQQLSVKPVVDRMQGTIGLSTSLPMMSSVNQQQLDNASTLMVRTSADAVRRQFRRPTEADASCEKRLSGLKQVLRHSSLPPFERSVHHHHHRKIGARLHHLTTIKAPVELGVVVRFG